MNKPFYRSETAEPEPDAPPVVPEAPKETPVVDTEEPERPKKKGNEPPSPEPSSEPTARPENVEQEKPAENLAELLERWELEIKETKDGARKQDLVYRSVKLRLALSVCGLRAEDVKIAEAEPGTLAFYVPNAKDVYFTPQGLELDANDYPHILYHELMHKQGAHDEGLAEALTVHRFGPMPGIYEGEQRKLDQTFGDLDSVHEHYDIHNPKNLVEMYLDEEAKRLWKESLHLFEEKKRRQNVKSIVRRNQLFKDLFGEKMDVLKVHFEKALPRLAEALHGFDFDQYTRELLHEYYEEEYPEAKAA